MFGRTTLCWMLAGAVLSVGVPATAWAQSPADIATARGLARTGIKLFQSGKFSEALDKLNRAQALYDAPIHLLYIARCQVKLGLLIDGAESYRKLQRARLTEKSPPAFKKAVEDAGPELSQLEPRIPKLRVEVDPPGVEGLELRIDDQLVSSAVIGVDRPANPGARVVVVRAPGYKEARVEVTLEEGATKVARLTLVEDPDALVVPPPTAPGDGTKIPDSGGGSDDSKPGKDEPPAGLDDFGFVVGLRLGGALPTGQIAKDTQGNDVSLSDQFQAGAGGELRLGARWRYLKGFFFFSHQFLSPGDDFKQALTTANTEVTTTATSRSLGFGVSAGTEPGKFGGYGELGLAFLHTFSADLEVSQGVQTCTGSVSYSGPALHGGAGINIPLSRNIQLVPYVDATFGSFTSVETSYESEDRCDRPGLLGGADTATTAVVPGADGQSDIDSNQQALHGLITIGLGAEFHGL